MRIKCIYLFIISVLCFGVNNLPAQTNKADSLKRVGNYSDALTEFKKLLEIDLAQNNVSGMCTDYNNIASIYTNIGDYKKATDYFYKALKLADGIKSPKEIAVINYNISQNYAVMGQYEVAKDYVNATLKLLKNENNADSIIGGCYILLAAIHQERGKYEEGIKYYKIAEEVFIKSGNKNYLADVYVNISNLEQEHGNYKLAIKYARKALKLFNETNDKLGIAVSYINIQVANYFTYENPANPDYKKQMQYCVALLDSATAVLNGIKSPEHFITIYQNKTELYEYLGNIDSSYAYIQKYLLIKDSIYDINKQKQIQELRIQYEADKKEKDNEVLAEQNKNKGYFIIIIITGCALVVSVLLLVLIRNNSRKKQKEIEFEKSKLELEQKTLRAQMNPHFLFNAINSIQRYILKKDEQEAYDYLAKFSKLMRIVLNNSQEKVLMLSQELEMIRLYVEMEQLRFTDSFDFIVNISNEINEDETRVPAMLIQPYIENAIWHGLMNLKGEREGFLQLDIKVVNGELRIIIEDNGIGREKAKSYNTDEKHKSVGMKLTEQRLLMINKMQEYGNSKVTVTDLCDENKKGIGTKVEISLPIDGK